MLRYEFSCTLVYDLSRPGHFAARHIYQGPRIAYNFFYVFSYFLSSRDFFRQFVSNRHLSYSWVSVVYQKKKKNKIQRTTKESPVTVPAAVPRYFILLISKIIRDYMLRKKNPIIEILVWTIKLCLRPRSILTLHCFNQIEPPGATQL